MKKSVLLVEDEPVIAEMISIILEEEGFDVVSSSDIVFATSKIEEDAPGIILLDLQLENGDTRSFCKTIKIDELLKHIPVILVSANSEIKQIASDYGADDYIAKPFTLENFIEKIKAYSDNIG